MLESLLKFVAGAFTIILYASVAVFILFQIIAFVYRVVNHYKEKKAREIASNTAVSDDVTNTSIQKLGNTRREIANNAAVPAKATYANIASFGSKRHDIIGEYFQSANQPPLELPEDRQANHSDLKIDALFVRKDQMYENEYAFLRRCDGGYRAFYIKRNDIEGMYYAPKDGFDFPECPDEQLILDIFKGNAEYDDCEMYDCLLNEYDVKLLAEQLKQNNVPGADRGILTKRVNYTNPPCNITAVCWANGRRIPCGGEKAYNMLKAIGKSANYGGVSKASREKKTVPARPEEIAIERAEPKKSNAKFGAERPDVIKDYTPPAPLAVRKYALFTDETTPDWDIVSIDMLTGRAFAHNHPQRYEDRMTDEDYNIEISYDQLRKRAAKANIPEWRFRELNEHNWRDYIPEDEFKRLAPKPEKPVEFPADMFSDHINLNLDALFAFVGLTHSTYCSFLRRCDSGYRAFYASLSNADGVIDRFSECPDEEQILEILKSDDALGRYRKRDRLLAEPDLQYLARLLEENELSAGAHTVELHNSTSETVKVTAICWKNGERIPCAGKAAYNLHSAIATCAEYGVVIKAD